MTFAVRLAAVTLFLALGVAPNALGQGTDQPKTSTQVKAKRRVTQEAQAILEPKLRSWLDTLEERARKVIGQQLADGRFLLFIKSEISPDKFVTRVSIQSKNTTLTTLPIALSAAEKQRVAAESLTVEQIALVSTPISVTITFDNDVADAQINAIKEAIVSAIGLNMAKGDTIQTKKAPLLGSSTTTKLETLNTKLAEGSKDVEKLRYEISLAQQKISQVEAERLKLQTDLKLTQDKVTAAEQRVIEEKEKTAAAEDRVKEEKEKLRRMEDDLSVYKTPLGEIKKLIKGLELPLTVLPIAFILFVLATAGFFVYLRFQGAKTGKLLQAADVMAQAFAKAGRGGNQQGLTLDAARAEFAKLAASQNEEASHALPNNVPHALLGEELASTRQEAMDAWADLTKYPYLTFAELREWLVGGGSQTQRFIAIVSALGPIESMRLLQQFAHDDLALLQGNAFDDGSKLPGYAALLQLHRSVTAEVIRRPACITTLDFPELVSASDDSLASALENCDALNIAVCINLLPKSRKNKIIEMLSAERQKDCVDGIASLDGLSEQQIESQIGSLKQTIGPTLASGTVPKLGAAEDMVLLLKESSPKTRAALQESLGRHEEFREKVTHKMVTFDDVMNVEDDTLSEMLDEFEPEQLAALVSGLQNQMQQRIAKILSRKVIVAVQSELQRLNSRQALLKRAQTQSVALQAVLTDKLKALVDEGVVELRRKERQTGAGDEALALEQPSGGGGEETA